ncbi:MAG: carbon-nitrogen hydrolase family protein [Opitutaceae bacterium]
MPAILPCLFRSSFLVAAAGVSIALAPVKGAPSVQPGPNLIPNPALRAGPNGWPEAWTRWTPRPDLAPRYAVVRQDGHASLLIEATHFQDYGKWIALVRGIEPGKYYRFEAMHQSWGVKSDETSVVAVLGWYRNPDGTGEIQRDYVDHERAKGAWCEDYRTIQAPAGARSVTVELGLRWTPSGLAIWKDPQLTEVPPPPPREVRIATTHLRPGTHPTLASNTRLVAEMLDRAGAQHPDVVLFSENFPSRFMRASLEARAEPIPGPYTRMLSEKAKRYRTYVIATLIERECGLYYNTAVLIDREGRIVGKYHKVQLSTAEIDEGLTPGRRFRVFHTDFGTIGIMTCYDNWFPETARVLRLLGAKIIFWPLAGDGQDAHFDAVLRSRAMDNGVYIVDSPTVGDTPAAIINPDGKIVGETNALPGLVVRTIDLNQEWRTRYLSVNSMGEGASIYIKERRPDAYSILTGRP